MHSTPTLRWPTADEHKLLPVSVARLMPLSGIQDYLHTPAQAGNDKGLPEKKLWKGLGMSFGASGTTSLAAAAASFAASTGVPGRADCTADAASLAACCGSSGIADFTAAAAPSAPFLACSTLLPPAG